MKPSLVGIKGNEAAGHITKNQLKENHVELAMPISKEETKAFIWSKIRIQWHRLWEKDTKGWHLNQIK